MEPKITPLDATLGAVATNVDLAGLDDDAWTTIEAAFHQHGILVFPGQGLAEADQSAFGARFGDIEELAPGVHTVSISNQKEDGSVTRPDEHRSRILRGNEGWHTDSSYMPLAAKASAIAAVVVPPEGGQTEWADMRAAYDALDDEMQERIADLAAYHSLYYSQGKTGHEVKPGAGYGFHREEAPLRPLVKVHPATGRKSLFIGRHAYGIPGLDATESETLLDDLMTFACQAPRTYRHEWEPGDLVIWDNRCMLHRACPYDYGEVRVMRHTRIAGDPATEQALNTELVSNAGLR